MYVITVRLEKCVMNWNGKKNKKIILYKMENGSMKILAEMPTGMGSKWILAEFENNFYGYGTVADFNDKYGLPVNQFGTKNTYRNYVKLYI